MNPEEGRVDLPHNPARKEISPRRGLIFYFALSALIHWVALTSLLGPPRSGAGPGEAPRPQPPLAASFRSERPKPEKLVEPEPTAPEKAARTMPTEPAVEKPAPAKDKPAAPDAREYLLAVDVDETAKPISFGPLIYPVEQLLNGISGVVVVDVLIDSTGHIDGVRLIRAEPPGLFEQAAVAAISETTFRPAYRGGAPVRSVKRIEVNFDPREEPPPP